MRIGRLNESQNETNRAAFCDAGMSSVPAKRDRLVGDHADGLTADGGERGDDVRRPLRSQLPHRRLVDDRSDHPAHVVATGRRVGDQRAGLVAVAIDGIVVVETGRFLVRARRQVAEQLLDGGVRSGEVGHHRRRHPGGAGVAGGATQLVGRDADAGELLHHHGPLHERIAALGHDDKVGEADEQCGTRDSGAVDDHDGGDEPRARRQRPGEAPPGVKGRHSLDDVGAGRRHGDDQRDARLARRLCGCFEHV
ncbi:MAG: hypothetical protein WKF58_19215 [Ilumatobacteraceae bacterium]